MSFILLLHPLFPVQSTRHQFANKQRCRIVSVHGKADILLFAADKTAAYIIPRIAEINVYIIAQPAGLLEGILNQGFTDSVSLVIPGNANRSKGKDRWPGICMLCSFFPMFELGNPCIILAVQIFSR